MFYLRRGRPRLKRDELLKCLPLSYCRRLVSLREELKHLRRMDEFVTAGPCEARPVASRDPEGREERWCALDRCLFEIVDHAVFPSCASCPPRTNGPDIG